MAKKKVRRSIADLPEHLIHHILAFLSTKQATRTSILSKSWLSAWRTLPTLVFDFELFFRKELKNQNYLYWDRKEKHKRNKKFVKDVKRTLKRYSKEKIGIETFKLLINNGWFNWNPFFKRCMQAAAENGVKNLHLNLHGRELPKNLFEVKSLADLVLEEVTLVKQSAKKIARLDRLKSLSLSFANLDYVAFEQMMLSCQSIEILEISYCAQGDDFFPNFKVPKLDNLKEFSITLESYQSLFLNEEPSLESLICINNEDYLHDGDWLPCGFNLLSSQYPNLKTLLLCAVDITDNFFVNLAHKFPLLEDLSIKYCQDLRRIKISSPSLRKIQLVESWELEEAQFDVPGIVQFYYYDSDCRIIPELCFTAPSGRWFSDISISWNEDVDTSWFLKLKKLLASLSQCEITLNLGFRGNTAFDFNEITDEGISLEPQEVHVLSFSIYRDFPDTLSVLDVIFWICRPKTIMKYWVDGVYGSNNSLKYLYEMLKLRRNHEKLHNLQQIKFWQNDLMKVQLEIFGSDVFWLGNTGKFLAVGQGRQLLGVKALDWENFLKVLRIDHLTKERMIAFNLEWRPHRKSKKAKRKASGICKKAKKSKRLHSDLA